MSLRLRLTLLYSVILALMLAIGGTALYITLSRARLATVENALATDIRKLTSAGRFHLDIRDRTSWPLGASTTLFQARDLDGAVLDRSPGLGAAELPLGDAGLRAVRAGQSGIGQAPGDGERLLIESRSLVVRGQSAGIIQAARSLDEYDQSLATLKMTPFAGGGLGLLVAFGAGWLLAGAVLRPIDRITQTARAIGTERD